MDRPSSTPTRPPAVSAPPLAGLARKLVAERLLTPQQAQEACHEAERQGGSVVRRLVAQGHLPGLVIARLAAREFGLPLLDLDSLTPDRQLVATLDAKLLRKHAVLPLRQRGKRLFVAVADPTRHESLNEIRFQSGAALELVVVEDDKLQRVLNGVLERDAQAQDYGSGELLFESLAVQEEAPGEETTDGSDEAPIVRLVNQVLLDAITLGASDIHWEPFERSYRVRCRVDGVLRELLRPPRQLAARIGARLKIMASMDIAERRVPQDGRFKLKLAHAKAVDFRINTLPTLWGEKVVLRLLDGNAAGWNIDALGYEPEQKQLLLAALQRPQGLILVTGPTGSGKTMSLYAALGMLNDQTRNLCSAEDPVEINLEGVNQVAVNPRVGLSFAAALRAFLRQDPDVVMVGEMRDTETAEIAIKAAQTGHLVLSTLHTNSAAQTLTRLLNMGIAPYNVAAALTLVVAQRLARRLCPHCRKPQRLSPHALLQAGFTEASVHDLQLFEPVGCRHCHQGYKGRVGIYEMLPLSPAIATAITEQGAAADIARLAREAGYRNLRTAALDKAAQGLTSLTEAQRLG
ncbi:MAG TPA: type IV-A pilus assembly ATPase PilB [Hyphomicrobiales bacterium]|nr:type IV-A pilus assembly ATPase PilB [Hyphomicrobiales bacterium]